MPRRPCLLCGALANGNYCGRCRPRGAWSGGSTRAWRRLRLQALRRDGFRCRICGQSEDLEVHHLFPKAEGGPDVLENAITLCEYCHAGEHESG